MLIHYPGFQSFEFHFENCETANIRVSYIGLIQINNIQVSLGRLSQSQPIDYTKSCSSFMISIHRSYNENHQYNDGWNHYDDLFERFHQNDIVDFKIQLSNDKNETIHVPWSDDEYVNKFQTTIKNNFGDLFIFISSSEKDFLYYKENLNDEYMISTFFSLKDIEEYSKMMKR